MCVCVSVCAREEGLLYIYLFILLCFVCLQIHVLKIVNKPNTKDTRRKCFKSKKSKCQEKNKKTAWQRRHPHRHCKRRLRIPRCASPTTESDTRELFTLCKTSSFSPKYQCVWEHYMHLLSNIICLHVQYPRMKWINQGMNKRRHKIYDSDELSSIFSSDCCVSGSGSGLPKGSSGPGAGDLSGSLALIINCNCVLFLYIKHYAYKFCIINIYISQCKYRQPPLGRVYTARLYNTAGD